MLKGYLLYNPEIGKTLYSRNVTFNENAMLSSGKDTVVSSTSTDDEESAREKVEFEIEAPEEDIPNSSTQPPDDQTIMSNDAIEYVSPQQQHRL